MEWIAAGVATVVGLLIGLFFERMRLGPAYRNKEQLLYEAKVEADNLRKTGELEIKEDLLSPQGRPEQRVEQDTRRAAGLRTQARQARSGLGELDNQIKAKEKMLQTTQNRLSEKAKSAEAHERELEKLLKQEQEQLYQIAGLDQIPPTDMLLSQLERELKSETGALIIKKERNSSSSPSGWPAKSSAWPSSGTPRATPPRPPSPPIDIPSDEMKGRIIGREGRNIRAFEKATGVDVIVDDTPGVVIVSAFDRVRREIARLALNKLIEDGRIHPTRIEEVVAKRRRKWTTTSAKAGEKPPRKPASPGLHEKIIELMGRLRFRTSYSQNVLRHSIEVAYLTGMMAEQLGLDGKLARRCGFLHDIGKAADHEMEGGHPAIGAELLKRYGEGPEVVHAALGHHDDIRVDYIYTVLVAAADACSAPPSRCPPRIAGTVRPPSGRTRSRSPAASRASTRPSPCRPAAKSA